MQNISFRLKEPQKGTTPANQRETLVYLFFSYGYYETDLQGNKKYLPLKYSTGLKIFPHWWTSEKNKAKQSLKFDYQSFNNSLDKLVATAKNIQTQYGNIHPNKLRDYIKEEEGKATKSEALNLNMFIEKYINDITTGARLNKDKEKFKPSTIKTINGFKSLFYRYQNTLKRKYDFNDITMDFYNDFVKFMTSINYSPNTIGRQVKQLKIFMRLAKDEGLHKNTEFENKAFKSITKKVDNIYLTETELRQLWQLDLSNKPNLDHARDVFLIGCFTAQRYSDYHRINKNNIKDTFIELIQSKTQEKVIIPIRPELRQILIKYNYTLPKTHSQKVNNYIKEIGKLAGIDELIETENTKGGLIVKKTVPKYELIKTHTARRSGATNMYLAGIQSIDIMKITGHKTEREFLKYIKVTKEETANLLQSHPYFNTPLLKAN